MAEGRINGRLGAKLPWFPAALVTTRGHKPCEPRTIEANPQVHIQIRDRHFDVVARVASDEERKRYWPKLIRMYPPYRGYREATDREIPLVVRER